MNTEIKIFSVGPFQQNTILLKSKDKALLIDPGFYSETEYQSFKKEIGDYELLSVYLTHAHIDHILGLSRVLKDFDVPVHLSHKDLYLWENSHSQSQMFGLNMVKHNFVPQDIKEEFISEGPFEFRALFTPGHAPDHMAFYFEDEEFIIAGDLLFRESIGRTDLYKGDFNVLEESIRNQIYTLPPATKVYPGHGPLTTVSYEMQNNPFVKL